MLRHLVSFLLILLLSNTFYSNNLFGDNFPQISTQVKYSTNNLYLLEIKITTNDDSKVEKPDFEIDENFLIQVYSSSVRQQRVNNISRIQRTFVYSLKAKDNLQRGNYKTPKGEIRIGNIVYEIPREVFDYIPSNSTNSQVGLDPLPKNRLPKNIDEFSFVQIVSNENPYLGEQVSYRLELIPPANLREAKLEEFTPSGLWRERFEKDGKTSRMVQNITIHTFSEAWFPIEAGINNIPNRELKAHLQITQRRNRNSNYGSLSEQFFSGFFPLLDEIRIEEKIIKSNTITLNVKPLPKSPYLISGYIPVGEQKISTTLDKETAQVGESVTLKIQIISSGNLKPYNLPNPESPDLNKIRIYNDKPIFSRTVSKDRVYFYKTFLINIVPKESGNIKLPTFTIHWFDPKNEEYKKHTTKQFEILVEGRSSEDKFEDKDFDFKQDDKQIESQNEKITKDLERKYNYQIKTIPSNLNIILLISLLFLIISKTIFYRLKERTILTQKKLARENMLKESIKKLDNKPSLKQKEAEDILRDYLQFVFEIPSHSLTAFEIKKILSSKLSNKDSFSNDLIEELYKFFLESENSRFAKNSNFNKTLEVPSDLIKNLLEKLAK